MSLTHRLAAREDLPVLLPLIDAAINELQKDHLDEAQIRPGTRPGCGRCSPR
jgi:hypothetical protein